MAIFENRWRVIAVEICTQVLPDGRGCKEEEIQTPAAVGLYGNWDEVSGKIKG